MQFDVVQERQAQGETLVSSRLKLAEEDVDCLKRDSKALSEDAHEKPGKLQQYMLGSVLESTGMRYASTMKEWTGKARATIIYDSTVDEFAGGCLFQKVRGKENIAIVATTTDGDVFGGFYSVAVTEQWEEFFDPNIFLFSFESHGRCETPQRFDVKKKRMGDACVKFYKNDCDRWFVRFYGGDGWFSLGNERSRTFCYDLSRCFEGIEDPTLTGKNRIRFTCCRLVAIQFE